MEIQTLEGRDNLNVFDEDGRDEMKALLAELSRIKFKIKDIAKQKARYKWLRLRDRKTRFFHSVIKWRRT